MARVVSSMSRTTPAPDAGAALDPDAQDPAARVPWIAGDFRDEGDRLGGAEVEGGDQALGLGAHARALRTTTWPANRPSSS